MVTDLGQVLVWAGISMSMLQWTCCDPKCCPLNLTTPRPSRLDNTVT
eukprot:COSAG04_NODE_1261_length_7504_cov_2.488184_4_plen_47_part_00